MVALLEIDAQGTVVTPVAMDATRLEVRADYFTSPIDLPALQALYPVAQVLQAEPLVLRRGDAGHVVVFPFGAVVFWQCDEGVVNSVLAEIRGLPGMDDAVAEVRDTMCILADEAEERVGFREVRLRTLSLEHLSLISQTLAQSVALKHSELEVSRALKNTSPIVRALELRGALIPSGASIMKTVGFTLAVREAVLAKLRLFDDPAETWRSERLARLHSLLYDHFDIKKRLAALQEKVTFLSDMNQILMNLLQNRTSHRLEWIVIVLIVIEVIFSFYHFFAGT